MNTTRTNSPMAGHARPGAGASWRKAAMLCAMAAGLGLAGCNTQQVMTHGAVINQSQLDLVPVGSSREQVLLALGTPSTTGQFDAEVFYYISQTRSRRYAYQKPKLVDQRVLAVYFDEEGLVRQLADYGLQDGKIFDFIARATPTGGKDLTLLGQILAGPSREVGAPSSPVGF